LSCDNFGYDKALPTLQSRRVYHVLKASGQSASNGFGRQAGQTAVFRVQIRAGRAPLGFFL